MTAPAERPPEHFPYAWTEEADLPGFLRVRAEGLPLREAVWSGLGYLRKYRRGKWSAPPEEVRYFDHQRQLLRRLAAPLPPLSPRGRGAGGGGVGGQRSHLTPNPAPPRGEGDRTPEPATGPVDEDGVRLALVGDLMWLRDSWGSFLSPEVLAYLNGHDAVVGNLETPISTR